MMPCERIVQTRGGIGTTLDGELGPGELAASHDVLTGHLANLGARLRGSLHEGRRRTARQLLEWDLARKVPWPAITKRLS